MTPSSPPTPEKRKRGAQPGNLNARKHGLTPRPAPPEYNSARLQHVDLSAEIHILRQQLQLLAEASLLATSLAETVEIARVIAHTASALSRLIRAQVIVFSADTSSGSSLIDQWDAELMQALTEVNRELCKPDSPEAAPPGGDSSLESDPGLRPLQLSASYPGDPRERKKRR